MKKLYLSSLFRVNLKMKSHKAFHLTLAFFTVSSSASRLFCSILHPKHESTSIVEDNVSKITYKVFNKIGLRLPLAIIGFKSAFFLISISAQQTKCDESSESLLYMSKIEDETDSSERLIW